MRHKNSATYKYARLDAFAYETQLIVVNLRLFPFHIIVILGPLLTVSFIFAARVSTIVTIICFLVLGFSYIFFTTLLHEASLHLFVISAHLMGCKRLKHERVLWHMHCVVHANERSSEVELWPRSQGSHSCC